VVDQCPECARGDLDLSPQAFQLLSPLAAGRIPITWHEVPCEVSGPISYHFKDGANAFWTAIQIRNHRYPIAKLEADVDGTYVSVPRVDYNYFVQESGLGAGPYALRVTDTHGHVVEDVGVELGDDITRSGSSQFSTCP
jgi:expansin (peptidoglycan-binding protein)